MNAPLGTNFVLLIENFSHFFLSFYSKIFIRGENSKIKTQTSHLVVHPSPSDIWYLQIFSPQQQ